MTESPTTLTIEEAAAVMGRKGGKSRSPQKASTAKVNALKASQAAQRVRIARINSAINRLNKHHEP